MSQAIRTTIASRLCRLLPARIARRFVRAEEGAAAVEFALVAVPFLALLFAILETSLVFFANQTLESAATDASRLIMTGQAQTANYTQAQFKQAVCNRTYGMFDCANGLYVDVKNYASFAAISTTNPVVNGQLKTDSMSYLPSNPGCIVVVRLYYQWPIYTALLGNNLANLNGNKRLLVATSVFRNEPYGPTGSC